MMKNRLLIAAIAAVLSAGLLTPALAGGKADKDKSGVQTAPDRERVHMSMPYLGVIVSAIPPELSVHLDLKPGAGLVVFGVAPDSPAQKAGLKRHDILLKLSDQLLINVPQLQTLIAHRKAGDKVTLAVLRNGETKKLDVTLRSRGDVTRGKYRDEDKAQNKDKDKADRPHKKDKSAKEHEILVMVGPGRPPAPKPADKPDKHAKDADAQKRAQGKA